jgi:hypothetical protein
VQPIPGGVAEPPAQEPDPIGDLLASPGEAPAVEAPPQPAPAEPEPTPY